MQSQFIAAINQICDEKNIPRDKVIETIKAALRAAYRKDYGTKEQNIDIDLNENTNSAVVYLIKNVVKKVENQDLEMSLAEAKKYKKNPKVGDEIKIDVTPMEYGRIAAQAAKQVIIQRIQEAERDVMYENFKDRENELINALVHRVENQQVYVNLDNKITTMLPPDQQIPGEQYYGGQRIKLYLDKVIKTTKGPQLIISRTHPNLVRKLLELEIPEIKSGAVLIKGIAREPGVRCKVAVASTDEKIDPIGSCVGQKGVRVQNIMDELNGEKIDIIPWTENQEEYIKIALAPAKIAHIKLDEGDKRAACYVNPDQRPLAIGKNGQNVRLASHLTAWEIDIMDIGELQEQPKTPEQTAEDEEKAKTMTVEELKLSKEVEDKLKTANLTLIEQLKGLSAKDLQAVEGIDEKAAQEIAAAVKKVK
ncbi:transcription termination/antitermination protein NusA [Candidatus Peregrinibacteria bacterium]|nr:transcription termination/antitermination protein NusA [Candidatus Peregrinibacteria bacterium]